MRYVIGIDLGTTNSCASFVDLSGQIPSIQPFKILQLKDASISESFTTLPSFCYLPAENEWPKGSLDLPWNSQTEHFVGAMAQIQGARVPTRLVQSAKSWLCHSAADRRDKILPLEAADNERKISPVEASSLYLRHIAEAWNHTQGRADPELEFTQQEIILTIPASFDEAARTLTVEAARNAGIRNLTLLEEPQAAFYSWISFHEGNWEKSIPPGSKILICDIGGGTTDFSIIEVKESEQGPYFQRMAVGDHLLLGGDNMDAAIAHFLEKKIGMPLSNSQWLQLKHESRRAKEILLTERPPEQYRVSIQGRGASVVQGSLSTAIEKNELEDLLLGGFFGKCDWQEAAQLKRTAGLRTLGLPYEEEPSILKHLAYFLASCSGKGKEPQKPDYILFNGGAMKPLMFQKTILDSIEEWFGKRPSVLPSHNLDLAVARGAAYYGRARQGLGIKILGGSARSFYLSIDVKKDGRHSQQALTIMPRGAQDGYEYESSENLYVIPNTPVSFTLLSSHVRLEDVPGTLVDIDPSEMQPLPPIHTALRFGKQQNNEKIPVSILVKLSAIGVLEIWLKSRQTSHAWLLEFQLKGAENPSEMYSQPDTIRKDETFEKDFLKPAEESISKFFKPGSSIKPSKLIELLEDQLHKAKNEWSASILRGLWESLRDAAPHRKVSAEHESRWWNLAGFFLRPGFGYPLDDHRAKELWKINLADSNKPISNDAEVQKWICFRRVAGGLNKGQQAQIAAGLLDAVYKPKTGKNEQYRNTERLRTVSSMELLELSSKIKLGDMLIEKITALEAGEVELWALSRIGARQLVYGSIANVVSREKTEQWIDKLLESKLDLEKISYLLGQLARKTSSREVNISQKSLDKILRRYEGTQEYYSLSNYLTNITSIQAENEEILGDRIPPGIILEG